jgi:hypothetical protein
MGIQAVDELPYREGVLLAEDVYDLSWTAFYRLEVYGKPSIMGIMGKIDSILRSIVDESGEYLHAILYDKEIVVGVLLGYYVLLRTKYYDVRSARLKLSKVLSIIKSYIDGYSAYGEVLYALKKLDKIVDVVQRYVDVDAKVRTAFNNLRSMLVEPNLRIEHVEDLFYIVWLICEHRMHDIADEEELARLLLDERLYNLAIMDFESSAIYANAVASFITRYRFKESYRSLRERIEELYKTLRYHDESLAKVGEGLSGALVSKIKLGIHNLDEALQRLRSLDEARKMQRRYGIPLASLLLLMAVLLWISPMIPGTLLDFVNSYRDRIAGALIFISASLFTDIFGGGIVGKMIRGFLEALENLIKH